MFSLLDRGEVLVVIGLLSVPLLLDLLSTPLGEFLALLVQGGEAVLVEGGVLVQLGQEQFLGRYFHLLSLLGSSQCPLLLHLLLFLLGLLLQGDLLQDVLRVVQFEHTGVIHVFESNAQGRQGFVTDGVALAQHLVEVFVHRRSPHLQSEVGECLDHAVQVLSLLLRVALGLLGESEAHAGEDEVHVLQDSLDERVQSGVVLQVHVSAIDEQVEFSDCIRGVEVVAQVGIDFLLGALEFLMQCELLLPPLLGQVQRVVAQMDTHVGEELFVVLLLIHRLRQTVLVVVHQSVIFVQQEQNAQLSSIVGLQQGLDGNEVLQRLAHLQAVDVQVSRVQEVVHPLGLLVVSLGLSDLVGVVGELQVHASRVDVDRVVRVTGGHGGTLDVPPGTTLAPGRVPPRLVWLALLPEGKVSIRPLLLGSVTVEHALSFSQQLGVVDGSRLQTAVVVLPVGLEVCHVEVHRPVRLVRVAICDDLLDERDDLGHELRYSRENLGSLHVELLHVLPELLLHLLGELSEVHLSLVGPLDDLVVNVSDVHLHDDVVPEEVSHDLPEGVETDVSTRVSHVRQVIHGGTAHVPLHSFVFQRHEVHLACNKKALPRCSPATGCS